jgi:hypothetical protein
MYRSEQSFTGLWPDDLCSSIVSKKQNKRGVPVFRGTILENENTVQLDQTLKAQDADEVGGASKY